MADVHLGYSWAQRRRGELGPLADFRTRDKLFALVDGLRPQRLVFLGDLVHAPRPCEAEREWIENVLLELSGSTQVIAVRGNHDRAFTRDFGHLNIEQREYWAEDSMVAVHGDKLNAAPMGEGSLLVAGHFHPCLGVRDASGASQKLPVFLVSQRFVVLPAFSPFARGYDVLCGLPTELGERFGEEPVEVYAAAPKRVVRLGPLHRALERMEQINVSAPAQFRRRTAG